VWLRRSRSFDDASPLAPRRRRSHVKNMSVPKDILDIVGAVKTDAEAVAVATVVRGGAALAGARAVLSGDGAATGAWLTAAAARQAFRTARKCLEDGRARLFRARAQGAAIDVLVEPLLPRPHLVIAGATPVAAALADLARRLGFFVTICAPADAHGAFAEADRLVDGFAPQNLFGEFFLVIAAQDDDMAALKNLARLPARYFAVVGPRRQVAALKRALRRQGAPAADAIRLPAGLDIGAVTPEEIALSIVAEMVALRRHGQRVSP